MRSRYYITVFLICLCTVVATSAAAEKVASVPTSAALRIQQERIDFLTTSPPVWVRDLPPDQGRYLRFIAYFQIEEVPQEFRIESWTYGDEGCCSRLIRSRQFTFAEPIGAAFSPLNPKSCKANFVFHRWISLTSFRFQFMCANFIAEDVHKEVFSVRLAQ